MKKVNLLLLLLLIIILPINGLFNAKFLKDFNEKEKIKRIDNNLRVSSAFEDEFISDWNASWTDKNGFIPFELALDSSNDIYLAGDLSADCGLVKFNNSGQYQWNRTWGDYANYDEFFAITIDSSDNIYLAGWTESYNQDVCFLKYNISGDIQWEYTWGQVSPPTAESAHAIALDSLENIYFAGNNDTFGISDIFLVKYNKSGQYQWNNTWGGSGDDQCEDMTIDSLDNIYLAGITYNPDLNNYDIFLVKFNNLGHYQWNRTWMGKFDDRVYDIALDSSENIYLVGHTQSSIEGNNDICLIKYNNLGQYQWNRTWDQNIYDTARGIAIDPSDNLYIVGGTGDINTDIYKYCLLKYNKEGILQWNRTWGTEEFVGSELLFDIALDDMCNIYLAGITNRSGTGHYDMILMKYIRIITLNIDSPKDNELFGFVAPTFNLSIDDFALNTMWYTINNGQKVIFHELNGKIDHTEWSKAGNGTVNLEFYFNNTLGYECYNQAVVRKDIIDPVFTINKPIKEQEFDAPPAFNVSIEEPNLESFWYTIDNGQTNITLTDVVGIIDQNLWNLAAYGEITVRFFAKDKVGNLGYIEVTIIKISPYDKSSTILGYNLILIIFIVVSIGIILVKKNILNC